jgi:hypothetical protein
MVPATGQFGPPLFSVLSKEGAVVNAKWLTDNTGSSYIIDPNTGRPYVVPRDYDPSATAGMRRRAARRGSDTEIARRVIRRAAEDELSIRTVGKGITLAVCGAALIVMLHVYMSHRVQQRQQNHSVEVD